MSNAFQLTHNIKKIVEQAENSAEVEILWLYGSQARGSANENSDYDLAIAFKTYIKDPVERRLRPELLALKWTKRLSIQLSIVDINLAPLPLAYTVVEDNTLLYCRNQFRRYVEEQRIMSKWELDYLHHRKRYG